MNEFIYAIKGCLRVLARVIIEIFHRVILNLFDTLFGFLNFPGKNIRLKIFILRDQQDQKTISPNDLDAALNYTKKIFKEKFNVKLLTPGKDKSFVEVLNSSAPQNVLFTKGGNGALSEEFKIAGNFFAANLFAPIYPVTAFIVTGIEGATGCSLGPLTDYITLSHEGALDKTVLVHELAHACGLWHVKDKTNLLWHTSSRGDKIKWWQKNIFRSSRHVTYW